jgi:antitoxin FitA
MAEVIVRGLDDDVRDRLGRRAAAHGQSIEAEIRDILTQAVADDERSPYDVILDVAEELGGVDDLQLPERTELPRSVSFD